MKQKITEVISLVEKTYPGLGETARMVLAGAATTRLERQHPLSIILIGGPSSGKTTLLIPLTRGAKDTALKQSVLRLDDFTPAALVSHAANRKSEDLAKIDLLPRMAGKCVITKEMAPMFTGHEDDLMKKFAVFASILDGEGYISGSGCHGQRGYSERIVFTLMGAVTPDVLSKKVYSSMNAVGPRFCFWEIPPRNLDAEKWLGPNEERRAAEQKTSDAIQEFLEELFGKIQPGSVTRNEFVLTEEFRKALSSIAILMVRLRAKSSPMDEEEPRQTSIESPERAYRYLEQITFGSALLDERREIAPEDLRLALKVAVSSGIPVLRRIIGIFLDSDHSRTVHDLYVRLGINSDTAMKYARFLQELGVIQLSNDDGTTAWRLKPPFDALQALLRHP